MIGGQTLLQAMITVYAKSQKQGFYGGEELSNLEKRDENISMNKEDGVRRKWGQMFTLLWSHIKPSILSARRCYRRT